ncbi:hypothetical protein Bca101_017493 [Brassica carinata]
MHVPVNVTDYSLSSFYKGIYAVVDDTSLDSVGFIRVKGSKHRYHIGHPKYFVRGKPELMKKMQEEAHDKRMHKFEQNRAMRKKAKARAMKLADALGDLISSLIVAMCFLFVDIVNVGFLMNPFVPKTKSLVSPGYNCPLVVTGHTVYLMT